MATAYAALLSLLNDLEAIKNNPYHFFSFENKQIQSLGESIVFLIDFMESVNNYHGASKEAARVLEGAIARAAHAAEDVIESHVVDQILAGSTLHGKRTSRFLMDQQKVIEGMEFVKRKAMKVVRARSGHITELQPTNLPAATSSTTSDRNTMVGFDDVLHQLLHQLTGEASNLQIIPITGMGGIGKTTLAKTAFEHPLIVQHFDVCCWATILQYLNNMWSEDILSKLLSGYEKPNSGTVHELGEQLHKRLYRRRYLIVLDDMWSTEIWDDIQFFFPDTSNRSRIVVTTRLTEVADYLGSPCFPMRLLDEDRSWDLFCQKAFAGQGCPGELEDAGKKIVKKCKGLPLAITVVGGHLGKSPRTQEHWENVADHMMNTIFNSGENEQLQVFDILSLSYSYLPVHLKPCFLYMGTIREDKIVLKGDIIKPWIAEGFVKPNQTVESLETIAEGYLEDLIERNLVLLNDDLFRMHVPGKLVTCRMHDVIRELCLKIAKKEQFLDFLDAPRAICREERRVVISEKIPKECDFEIVDAQRSAPLIRSLTWIDGQVSYDLKLVRVLNAGREKIWNRGKFPSANLRYLECSSENAHGDPPHIPLLPMSHFWNLQTLILSYDKPIIILPYEIWDMVHLRHLGGLVGLPDPLYRDKSHQVNLQTLNRAENFRLIEEVCDKIPHVKELWLLYDKLGDKLERATSHFCPQNLGSFHELESLKCSFGDDTICHDFALSFSFPSSLKELYLYNTRLEWEELTVMVESLPLLQYLSLEYDAVIGSEWTPVEGTFLRLTHLGISCCRDLVYFNANSSHFPLFRYLFLGPSPKMNELPLQIGELPSLELLSLEGCNLSLAISALRILEDQEAQGNDCLQLQVSLKRNDDKIRFEEEVGKDGLTRKNLYVNFLTFSALLLYFILLGVFTIIRFDRFLYFHKMHL